MKKIICLLLAAVSVASLAACSNDSDTATTTATPEQAPAESTVITQPNELFKDVPTISGDIKFSNDDKNDKGYVYTRFVDGVDYAALKEYVSQLEDAGFSIYHANPLDTETTDDILPDTLDEGTYTAKWIGKRRGLYVAISWFADEYYEINNLPQDSNARLYFYTYNAFKTN